MGYTEGAAKKQAEQSPRKHRRRNLVPYNMVREERCKTTYNSRQIAPWMESNARCIPISQMSEIPSDFSAEKGVLASILLQPVAVLANVRANGISAESFYHPAHRTIFDAICEVQSNGGPVDFITLAGYLRTKGDLDRVGGAPALNELFIYLPSALNVAYYSEIVLAASLARRALALADSLRLAVESHAGGAAEALADTQAQIVAMLVQQNSTVKSTREIIREICYEVVHGKQNADLMPTGIAALDALLRLCRSDYLVIPGPTSSGKSALSAQICISLAKQGHRVLYVPLEMSAKQVLTRALAAESGYNADSVRHMVLHGRDTRGISRSESEVVDAVNAFTAGAQTVASLDLTVRDDVRDLDGILAMARGHAAQKPLDALCVDYPALMAMRGNFERRQLALAHASQSFKRFAGEIRGVVITPSQVNKEGGTREAADFENDANAILRVDFSENDDTQRIVQIAKQRDGERGQLVPVHWHGATTSFRENQIDPQI